MRQVRRINRIEVSHSSILWAHGRRVSLWQTGGWSWPGPCCSLRHRWWNDLHTGGGILLEDRRLQFPPVRIINLSPAVIRRLVLLSEGDAPVQKQPQTGLHRMGAGIAIGNPPLLQFSSENSSQGGFSPASHRACDFHRTRRSINANYLLHVCEETSFSLKPCIFFFAFTSNSLISA